MKWLTKEIMQQNELLKFEEFRTFCESHLLHIVRPTLGVVATSRWRSEIRKVKSFDELDKFLLGTVNKSSKEIFLEFVKENKKENLSQTDINYDILTAFEQDRKEG